ncbi:MAG TPA: GDYXXLXY domain-containing protein [Chthoniobacterales bacterium]
MKRLLLYVVLAVQICGLAGMYAWHARLPQARYLLQARPIDPRDLLRGDYIRLGYDISAAPAGTDLKEGDVAYVRLQQAGRFWTISTVSSIPPHDGAPWLRARWKGGELDYGIDEYFVPEGKGRPPGKITAAIAIHPDGQAQIVQLYSDGQPWP